jgi:hypothetical protein
MKNFLHTIPLLTLLALLASCSGSQDLSSYDDVYYTPSDEVYASVDEEYIDSDVAEVSSDEDYYDPDYREEYESNRRVVDNYSYDDYYYSNRMRRFRTNVYYGFNYYDPFFSYNSWNSYDPYFWSPRPWTPYTYSPGWNIGWNSFGGWNAGFNYGWGGYGAFNPYYPFSGFGYNPWGGYYGNAYCPPYGNGFAFNDVTYGGTPIYRGQFNSLGSMTSSTSTGLGRYTKSQNLGPDNSLEKPISTDFNSKPLDTGRPIDNARPAGQNVEKPVARTTESGVRPVERDWQKPTVAGTRPVERDVRPTTKPDYVRPQRDTQREDYRTRDTRPTRNTTEPNRDTRPVYDRGDYKPEPTYRPRERKQPEYNSPSRNRNSGTYQRNTSTPSRSTVTPRSNTRSTGSSTRSSSSPSRSSSSPSRGSRSGGRR